MSETSWFITACFSSVAILFIMVVFERRKRLENDIQVIEQALDAGFELTKKRYQLYKAGWGGYTILNFNLDGVRVEGEDFPATERDKAIKRFLEVTS